MVEGKEEAEGGISEEVDTMEAPKDVWILLPHILTAQIELGEPGWYKEDCLEANSPMAKKLPVLTLALQTPYLGKKMLLNLLKMVHTRVSADLAEAALQVAGGETRSQNLRLLISPRGFTKI